MTINISKCITIAVFFVITISCDRFLLDLLPVNVDSVNISKSKLDLMEGEEATLTATVTPDNATNKTVTWESSDSSIATVVNGKVTAVRPGKTTITVTTEDGGKSATCDVTVVPKSSDGNNESLDENVGEW